MPISRRAFIRIAGSTAVIAAAGAGTFAMTRDPSRALEPWRVAGTVETEPRRKALSYAILAPNPHNRQPWMVELVGDDELVLYCDPDRLLPVTDPFNRQITIGLGCFLELLRIAAAQDGYLAEVTPFPDGHDDSAIDGRPIARVKLSRGGAPDPLFAQVLARRSNKEPFDVTRHVRAGDLDAIAGSVGPVAGVAAHTEASPGMVEKLRDLTWRAFFMELETDDAYMESVELMRIGKSEIEANPDGIDLGGPMLETLNLFGVLTRETAADRSSSAYQQSVDMFREIMMTGMAYVWLTTPGNSRIDQLDAGRAYLRTNLQATALGVGMQPLSQALQEYEEMAALYEEANALLGTPEGARVQMLARLGYGPRIKPSPRWHAKTRLRTA